MAWYSAIDSAYCFVDFDLDFDVLEAFFPDPVPDMASRGAAGAALISAPVPFDSISYGREAFGSFSSAEIRSSISQKILRGTNYYISID
jgi:hypothetical protein